MVRGELIAQIMILSEEEKERFGRYKREDLLYITFYSADRNNNNAKYLDSNPCKLYDRRGGVSWNNEHYLAQGNTLCLAGSDP